MKIPLLGGFYRSRSLIASAQSCVNLYPENNPQDAESPITSYPRPGLTLLQTDVTQQSWRGIYMASNSALYGVVGKNVYYIDGNWALNLLGTLTSTTSQVSMIDNGLVIVVVDGTQYGYTINLVSNAFAQITDPAFFGADRADYLDTFFIFNVPGTNQMYSSPSDWIPGIAFDPLAIAGKSGYPDPLQGLVVMHREIWLIGTLTTEIWYNAGAPDFPFAILPGTFIEHGCAAKYSMIKAGLMIFWLSQDLRGNAIVIKGHNYQAERVSTYAIENEFQTYATIADAIGMTYQYQGHTHYVLTFPTANKTWDYDDTVGLWHELAWTDNDGNFNRYRLNCASFAYGKIIGGDWQNGNLYEVDIDNYTDNGQPITYLRSFPHVLDNLKRVFYDQFVVDMDVAHDLGNVDGSTDQDPPMVSLQWSDDRGQTYGNAVEQSLGGIGQTYTNIQFRRLGMGRDRVFKVSWSVPAKTAINGAYITTRSAGT